MSKNSSALSQPAYDYMLDLIMSKKLMPGDKIPENKVAEIFGISRTPVRDAMRQLANDGLIVIYPNRFAQVVEYTMETILEIGSLRIALDTMSIKLALLYGSHSDFLALKKIANDCSEASKANNFELRCKYDSDFHMELANISRNSLLIKFQKEINLRVQYIILHYPNTIANEVKHINQHMQIADALIDHDQKKALNLIIDHLTTFYNLSEAFPPNFFNLVDNSQL